MEKEGCQILKKDLSISFDSLAKIKSFLVLEFGAGKHCWRFPLKKTAL